MVNYRVDNVDEMLAQLQAASVAVVAGPDSHENGKCANKVELWQPMAWDAKNKVS